MISKPTDLPGVRARVIEYLRETGVSMFRTAINENRQPFRRGRSAEEDAQELARNEIRRVRDAELFWVNNDMTALALAAAPSLPSYSLHSEDLPAPAGLLVFDRSIGETKTYPAAFVRAIAWGPTPDGLLPGVWVSWYTDTDLNLERTPNEYFTQKSGFSGDFDELRRRMRRILPELCYDNESAMFFGDSQGPAVAAETGEEIAVETSAYRLDVVRATWALMQQPVARVDEAAFNRADRRRLQRNQIEPAPVRVIALRRPKSSSQGTDSGREYHHRWIVRGHWRQQWYPARQLHRPVWIAPHVKGPEDAPILGGEKVHAWTR